MKRSLIALLCTAVLAGVGAGCAQPSGTQEDGRLHIVTTMFPEYDWVRHILGDRAGEVEVTMLLDNGADIHSYQPSVQDMIEISTCDLFVHVGGTSDAWVEDALRERVNGDMVVVNLMEVLGSAVKEEEVVEGMEEDHHDHDHDQDGHGHDGEEAHTHTGEYDEHVWLSLRNAQTITRTLTEQLCRLDPEHRGVYEANRDSYLTQLQTLDEAYQQMVEGAPLDTVLFGDRFPFRYLLDDYGVAYYAAFPGCSAESEASFETVAFLAGKVDELGLPAILTMEQASHQIPRTIRENTREKNQEILTLNSMQSVTQAQIEAGMTYCGTMEQNLEVLRQALYGTG